MAIIRNVIQCNLCGDIIESTHRHDFKWCRCGKVAVDGGHDYMKRVYKKDGSYTDLSEFTEEEEKETNS